jgi:hypothetical protein
MRLDNVVSVAIRYRLDGPSNADGGEISPARPDGTSGTPAPCKVVPSLFSGGKAAKTWRSRIKQSNEYYSWTDWPWRWTERLSRNVGKYLQSTVRNIPENRSSSLQDRRNSIYHIL